MHLDAELDGVAGWGMRVGELRRKKGGGSHFKLVWDVGCGMRDTRAGGNTRTHTHAHRRSQGTASC